MLFCRHLKELYLDLQLKNIPIPNPSSQWLSNFPESFNSLETLNFSCLEPVVDFIVLERLVGRCHNLKTLKLNNGIRLEMVARLLSTAPQIIELGFGKLSDGYNPDILANVEAAFAGCRSLRRLSGGWGVVPNYLPALSCVCEGLTSLNLCQVIVQGPELTEFISRCKNLLQLWVCKCSF
jgi:transport inhibitor response 1